jgi:hypothetical protein
MEFSFFYILNVYENRYEDVNSVSWKTFRGIEEHAGANTKCLTVIWHFRNCIQYLL